MKQFFIYKDEDIIAMMEGTSYEFINEQSLYIFKNINRR